MIIESMFAFHLIVYGNSEKLLLANVQKTFNY